MKQIEFTNKFEYLSKSKKDFDLPSRATKNSAGYDFHSPVDFEVKSGETVEISLEIKVCIKRNEFLMIIPRSSLGFKNNNHITITNTVGVIDADYYNNPSNEGEIKARFHNFGPDTFKVKKNDKLLQGIFVKFDTVDNEKEIESERTGGFGSTDK